jgi:hypothetical protein
MLITNFRLFAPETIGHYLGAKWGDGSTYLLTWIGPETRPIGPEFLETFTRPGTEPDVLRWFRFDELAPLISTIAPRMRSSTEWGVAEKSLSWRHSRWFTREGEKGSNARKKRPD